MAVDGGLRGLFQKHLMSSGCHFQAIETGSTGRGIPDLNGCLNGTEFWIEFKKTNANAVNLSPEQVAWILRRRRARGNVYIGIRRKKSKTLRREACDELWLIHGDSAAELKSEGLKSPKIHVLGTWYGGPSKWDWEEILTQLIYKDSK